MGILQDPELERHLSVLHLLSDNQHEVMHASCEEPSQCDVPFPPDDDLRMKEFLSDKLVALDRDKAEFCYQLCRATDARRVVEIGTSYGVSTLYLAAAVRDNIRSGGGDGLVIGTEYEPKKATAARKNFADAQLDRFIELREGDLRKTLKRLESEVDFLLVDIWIPMARPALELVAPQLRPGAIVICDNTEVLRAEYEDYFAFINDPANGFRTMTLPFDGGLEMSVRV